MLLHVPSWFLNWKEAQKETVIHVLRPLYEELEDVIMQNLSENRVT
jgi:hypothetical protein